MTDEQIVGLFLKRDEMAIKNASEKYGAKLRSIAYRITGDMETAEECENDTYLEAWNRIPPNEPYSYLPQFLSKIARNISLNRCEERKRLKRSSFIVELTDEMEQCIPSPDDVESRIDGKVLGNAISCFLRSESKEKRIIFMRRYYCLDSVADIAKRLGIGESKVKTTLFRMRNDLRKYLIKEGYEL